MAMHRFRKFWIGGGGGGQTSAKLKCIWKAQRKSLTLDKVIQFLQLILCYGVTFSGLRNWLHNEAKRSGLIQDCLKVLHTV